MAGKSPQEPASGPRTLAQLEQDQRQEALLASRWVSLHGVGSLPTRHRSETGESLEREYGGQESQRVGLLDSSQIDADGHSSLEVWERLARLNHDGKRHGGGPRYASGTPLVGRSERLSPSEDERRLRIEHVLTFLLPDHVELLHMRYVEQLKLVDIAEECSVTYSAVIQRLETARQDFRRAYSTHYEDPLTREACHIVTREETE